MEKSEHLIIVAGEASGDLHASFLVDEIKRLDGAITFSGLGGELMQKSGVPLYENLVDLAVVGFAEVIRHLGKFQRMFDMILNKIEETRAAGVVLIDYPGFNLRLAREIKRRGLPTKVIYYISPQVWAWKENRVRVIKNFVDKMLVILPFEKEFYGRRDLDVTFVGHPLLDEIQVTRPPEDFLSSIGLSPEKPACQVVKMAGRPVVALLPGSRQREIERLLPVMLKAASLLYQDNRRLQFVLIKAPTVEMRTIERYATNVPFPLKIITEERYNALNAATLCLVASGTATLEAAILQKPMVIVYKTSLLTWILARLLIRIPYIGLVNVVAQKKIVPECVQFQATSGKIASEAKSLYKDEFKMKNIRAQLKKVKETLGEPHASRRAAQEVLKVMGKNPAVAN